MKNALIGLLAFLFAPRRRPKNWRAW